MASILSGSGLFLVIAGILLLVAKKKEAAAYRWACVFLVIAFAGVSAVRLAVSAILLLASCGLRTNVVAEKVPGWLRKGAWILAGMGFMAINIVDQILITLRNFSSANLSVLLVQVALLLLLMATEAQAPHAYVRKPRLQAVPAENSDRLFSLIAVLTLIYVIFDFVLGVKAAAGLGASQQFSHAMNVLFRNSPLAVVSALLSLIPDLAACALLLSTVNRKKHYLLAVFLLLLNRIPLVDALQEFVGIQAGLGGGTLTAIPVVLTLIFLSAVGFSWNKKWFKKIPVINLVALLLSVVMLLGGAVKAAEDSKSAIDNTKANIYRDIRGSYSGAVYGEAYDRRDVSGICTGLREITREEFYQPTYDAAYQAAYDQFYAQAYDDYFRWYGETNPEYVKTRAESEAKNNAQNAADNIASNLCDYLIGDLAYEVYDAVVGYTAEVDSEAYAVAEVYNGKKPEGVNSGDTFNGNRSYADVGSAKEAAKKATEWRKDGLQEFQYSGVYQIAYEAVDAVGIYNGALDRAYERIYDELYQPCTDAALAAAAQTAENRKGDVLDAFLNVLLPAVCAAIGLLALLLMNLGLTVREAERVPTGFRALLDWCYTNVGEKLQRYVKVMGGIYLAFGLIFMSGYAIAVALFFRGDLMFAAAALGIAVVGTIITAVNILLTYPLFSFAQLTADIRHIRDHGGMAIAGGKEEKCEEKKTAQGETAPAAPAKSEEAPAAPAPEVPAAEEEDDEFGDLPDL